MKGRATVVAENNRPGLFLDTLWAFPVEGARADAKFGWYAGAGTCTKLLRRCVLGIDMKRHSRFHDAKRQQPSALSNSSYTSSVASCMARTV